MLLASSSLYANILAILACMVKIYPGYKKVVVMTTHTVNSGSEMVGAKHVSGKKYILVYLHRQKQGKKNF